MKWMYRVSTSCVMFLMLCLGTACPRSEPGVQVDEPLVPPAKVVSADKIRAQKEKTLFSKELKESLHFAASLERESLRLIAKNNSFDAPTLFSVLSYAFEVASGTKKSAPRSIDCGRFQIEKGDIGQLNILKICERPYVIVATVQSKQEDAEIKVNFTTKEWASVVGLSVTLTNPNISCQLSLKEKKLNSMICENWAYFLSSNDASATEVRLKTMSFHRDQPLQLKLAGGFYHDLVERKKIDITVPLEGKIKLIEKEIEVKDDFADRIKTSEDIRNEKEANDQKSEQEKEYQKHIKEGQGQNQTSGESQNQGQVEGQSQEGNPHPSEIIEGQNSGGVPPQPTKNRGR